MSPLSPPDFTGVQPEHLLRVMQLCEQGRGDEILHHFEQEFAQLAGVKYAIAVSSATSGLHLSLLALGVKESDEVICPTFTFAASAFPIMYQQAQPVFVDSELQSWNMSPEHLEKAILDRQSKGKKPKAIIVVHGYGNPADLEQLLELAHRYSIPLVEDAANALGSTWKEKQVGGFGAIGVFSFNRNKIISAAAGGCVVTNDEKLAQKMRYFAHQAKTPAPYYHHEAVGYNYGLSPLLSEIIRVQLGALTHRVEKRKLVFEEYKKRSGDQASFQTELVGGQSNRWLTVLVPKQSTQVLTNIKVQHSNVWKPMHLQPIFQQMPYYGAKESELFFERACCLPFLSELLFQSSVVL